jgi:hypothetical protein
MTNDDLIAALRSPGSQTMAQPPSVGSAMQGAFGVHPQQLQHMAGDVVPFQGSAANTNDLYGKILQPAGATAIRHMGGFSQKPSNVVPISPSVLDQMSRYGK